jgi:hypothetical protein
LLNQSPPLLIELCIPCLPDLVAEVYYAITKAMFLQEIEFYGDIFGQGSFASSHYVRYEQQLALVDQFCLESVGSEVGITNQDFLASSCFQLPDCFRIEISLNPRLARGYSFLYLRIQDFFRCLPDLRKVTHA